MKLHIKNQLNDNLTIEFCCGPKEYTLQHDQEIDIEAEDGDCMYFDIVRAERSANALATLTRREVLTLAESKARNSLAKRLYEAANKDFDEEWARIFKKYGLPEDIQVSVDGKTGEMSAREDSPISEAALIALKLQRLRIGILPLILLPVVAVFVRREVA